MKKYVHRCSNAECVDRDNLQYLYADRLHQCWKCNQLLELITVENPLCDWVDPYSKEAVEASQAVDSGDKRSNGDWPLDSCI